MIYLKDRLHWHRKGHKVNQILAFQWIIYTISKKDVYIHLTPNVSITHHEQAYAGIEFAWMIFVLAIIVPKELFHKGLIEEARILENHKK